MKLNPIKSNVTELELDNGTRILFSYKTPVAAWIAGRGFIRTTTHYSQTTTRHINQWLENRQCEQVNQSEIDRLTA